MSQIASFYLIKDDRKEELSAGGCSGEVYMALWDWCEGDLDMNVRFHASQAEDPLDCALLDERMAAELLAALQEQSLPALAARIAPDWDLPNQAVERGLETLLSHLKQVQDDTVLLYEMT